MICFTHRLAAINNRWPLAGFLRITCMRLPTSERMREPTRGFLFGEAMNKPLNLKGIKFGKLTVIERSTNSKSGKARWRCVCDCGKETVSVSSNLVNGMSTTCGCGQREAASRVWKTHGLSNTVEYTREKNRINYHKRKNDPLFAASLRVRMLIRDSLKKRSVKKSTTASDILGCSYNFFKLHIERQFTKGMCWERFSEIHIDHITPLSSAKTYQEVVALCHFTNLRPMWAKDNMKKNDKIEFLI